MIASDAVKSKSIFEGYETAAKALVSGLTRTRATELSEKKSSLVISPASMRALYDSLDCDGWRKQGGANWVWRTTVPKHSKGNSAEVSLEREVAALDLKQWTCQMSTSSGVQGPYLNKRRAIDLVRFIGDGRFAFVELKVGSDNPLYAAFEILGYALAYLHARTNNWHGSWGHDVLTAESVELTILGPEGWYKYQKRGSNEELEFKLKWLAGEITESLNAFVGDMFKGKPTFSMVFRRFSGKGNAAQQAQEIHRLAGKDWWKGEPLA